MDTHKAASSHAGPKVAVYSSPSCAYCHLAMDYFDSKGIEYTEKNITTDETALKFVMEEVGQAVTPIITIDEEIIVGFDKPKIDQALARKPNSK